MEPGPEACPSLPSLVLGAVPQVLATSGVAKGQQHHHPGLSRMQSLGPLDLLDQHVHFEKIPVIHIQTRARVAQQEPRPLLRPQRGLEGPQPLVSQDAVGTPG